jgi:hypothetical protein
MPKIQDLKVLIGCDPEVFVWDTVNEEFVSAHGMVGGTKADPQEIEDGIVMVDGMALEFGPKPCYDEKEWLSRLKGCVNTLRRMIGDRYQLVFEPTAEFSQETMDAQPEEALELGCEPDWSAYTLGYNPTPEADGKNFRSGGGHIHVGWGEDFDTDHPEFLKQCGVLVREMDRQILIPSGEWDTDAQRMQLYGNPGAFRPKPYGLEYRSPSNRWMAHPKTQLFVFRQTVESIRRVIEKPVVRVDPVSVERIQEAPIIREAYALQEGVDLSEVRR